MPDDDAESLPQTARGGALAIRHSSFVIPRPLRGQGQVLDEAHLEVGVEVELDDLHVAPQAGELGDGAHVQQAEHGAGEGGVADELDLRKGEAGNPSML